VRRGAGIDAAISLSCARICASIVYRERRCIARTKIAPRISRARFVQKTGFGERR
jgi:hypothetical protein